MPGGRVEEESDSSRYVSVLHKDLATQTVTAYQICLRTEDLGEVVLEPNSYMSCRIQYEAFEVLWLCYSDDSEN